MGVDVTTTPHPVRVHGRRVWREWTADDCPCQVHLVIRYDCTDDKQRDAKMIVDAGAVGGTDNFRLLWEWIPGHTADEVAMKIEQYGFGGIFEGAFNPKTAKHVDKPEGEIWWTR